MDSAEFVREPARDVPVQWRADVVVCGGGPAGTAAALASARAGADTILVERYGCLGGLATGGLVLVLPRFRDSDQQTIGGLGYEIRQRLLDSGEASLMGRSDESAFDPEALKWLSVDLCREAGVRVLMHLWIAGAVADAEGIRAVAVESKAGRLAIEGKVFVDATGDGDVFAAAGAEFEESTQWVGLPFRLAHVDLAAWERARTEDEAAVRDGIEQARKAGGWGSYFGISPLPTPGGLVWGNNMYREVSALDPEALTSVECEARNAIRTSLAVLRDSVPGFHDAVLVDTASQLGVRRSRRLVGDYVLTGDDVAGGRRFEDVVGRGNDYRSAGAAYDIPYRSLVTSAIPNLVTAGRCVSATHEALEPLREIHVCWVTGEAAGAAAGMAAASGTPMPKLDARPLQERLRAAKVALGPA